MASDPDKSPSRPAEDREAAGDAAQSEARQVLDTLMVEARKLVIEMRRLLREQRKQREH